MHSASSQTTRRLDGGECLCPSDVRFCLTFTALYRSIRTETSEQNLNKVDSYWASFLTFFRFYTRSLRFADAYSKGLSGKQAAWANKKYREHRVIPDTIFEELTAAKVTAD
ncbi:hypothetical protein BV20DRAFT_955611 [Pilatotrama ljubarskyi]|nr:hypothetical protein BV20DRAFT_955611 [Pilatotrama ljubarskyi]